MVPRLDPLSHFHRYRGGFNVTSMHYWGSLACTGAWGYAMAAACFVWGAWSILWQKTHWRRALEEVKFRFPTTGVPVLCAILFGALLLSASGVVFWGNRRLSDELERTTCTLVGTADKVALQVDGAVNLIPLSMVGPIANQEVAKKFVSAFSELRRTFKNLTHKIKLHRAYIDAVSTTTTMVVSTVAALMVGVVVIGCVSMFSSWPALILVVYLLCVCTVVASWMATGLGFVLTILAVDGCDAMETYTRSPHNSSIGHILPCLTPQGAANALSGAKKAIKTVIQRSNAAVDLLNRQEQKLAARNLVPYPTTLPRICDPFGPEPDFLPVDCSAEEGSFARFGEDYGKYCCDSDDIDSCLASPTPIPKFAFTDASQAMNATADVYMILPTVFRIITCEFVTLTFEDITTNRCGPLQGWLALLWIAFTVVSLALMLLLLLCDVLGRKLSNDSAAAALPKLLLQPPPDLSSTELHPESSETGTGAADRTGASERADDVDHVKWSAVIRQALH